MTVEIFTDGACRGNPGPGGWAAYLRRHDTNKLIKGAEATTTNNRMELMAAIAGLEALTRPSEVVLTTDSQYTPGHYPMDSRLEEKWLVNQSEKAG